MADGLRRIGPALALADAVLGTADGAADVAFLNAEFPDEPQDPISGTTPAAGEAPPGQPYRLTGGAATPTDPALLLRVEQDGRNSMSGCMAPADIPGLLRTIAGNIEAQLGGAQPTVPLLSDRDRLLLAFALDLAGDRMASRSNEFDDEDQAALAALRKLAGGEQA
jgi:hypothetical protein